MSGVREARKPLTHRDLGSHQGGDTPKAVVEDFEQVAGFGSRDGSAGGVARGARGGSARISDCKLGNGGTSPFTLRVPAAGTSRRG
jgi:hypothetical protein